MRSKVLMAGVICLISALTWGCACDPILFKPKVDPSALFALSVPRDIETLDMLPRLQTFVKMGMDQRGRPDGRGYKEFFNHVERVGTASIGYMFELYTKDEGAIESYSYEYNRASRVPVYEQKQSGEWSCFFTYIEQPRQDPEGFCRPQPYYRSQVVCQARNLVVEIEARDIKPGSEMLTGSLRLLADMLKKAIGEKGLPVSNGPIDRLPVASRF